MKIEANENALWCTFWICVMIVITSVTCAVYKYNSTIDKLAIENGYVEQMHPGSSHEVWVKEKNADNN